MARLLNQANSAIPRNSPERVQAGYSRVCYVFRVYNVSKEHFDRATFPKAHGVAALKSLKPHASFSSCRRLMYRCIIQSHVHGSGPLARVPFSRSLPAPTSAANKAASHPEVLSSAPPAPATFSHSLPAPPSAAGRSEFLRETSASLCSSPQRRRQAFSFDVPARRESRIRLVRGGWLAVRYRG